MRTAIVASIAWVLLAGGHIEAQAQGQAHARVRPGEVLTLAGPRASIKTGESVAAVSIPPVLARQLGAAQDYFFVGGAAIESGGAWCSATSCSCSAACSP